MMTLSPRSHDVEGGRRYVLVDAFAGLVRASYASGGDRDCAGRRTQNRAGLDEIIDVGLRIARASTCGPPAGQLQRRSERVRSFAQLIITAAARRAADTIKAALWPSMYAVSVAAKAAELTPK